MEYKYIMIRYGEIGTKGKNKKNKKLTKKIKVTVETPSTPATPSWKWSPPCPPNFWALKMLF